MLSLTQIQSCLGEVKTKKKVLTDQDKVNILAMVENGEDFETIVRVVKEGNDRVKTGHVREYLKRKMRRLLKDEEK